MIPLKSDRDDRHTRHWGFIHLQVHRHHCVLELTQCVRLNGLSVMCSEIICCTESLGYANAT